MKTINTYLRQSLKISQNENIIERLKLNKDTKIYTRDLDNWSILNAEPGDIVQLSNGSVFFAYKGLKKLIFDRGEAIEYYWCVDLERFDDFYKEPDTGVGTTNNLQSYKLALEEDKEKVFSYLKNHGYKWDENKLELKKI